MLTAWSFFAYNVILYYVKKASIIFYYKAKQMNVKYTLFFLLKLCNNKYAITTKNETHYYLVYVHSFCLQELWWHSVPLAQLVRADGS